MTQNTSPRRISAFTRIDFGRMGKQSGHIMFPHSPNDDAWGVTRVPIAVIANGKGPTVIVEGGNHGDEYEGPIIIGELLRELDPAAIQGRLILMPSNNIHAVMAAQRVSPVDGLNFNRAFPGDPLGSITQQIAAYVTDHIFPMGDAFIDLHSGGSSLDFVPSATIEPAAEPELTVRNHAAARAFDAPLTVIISNLGEPRTSMATACRSGLVTVGTELGGGGRVSAGALDVGRKGVRKVLAHLGVLEGEPNRAPTSGRPIHELKGSRAFVYAPTEGIFEPFHELGAQVKAGQPAGRIHRIWDPASAPEALTYEADGIVYARRQPGRVRPGNCCLAVASPH